MPIPMVPLVQARARWPGGVIPSRGDVGQSIETRGHPLQTRDARPKKFVARCRALGLARPSRDLVFIRRYFFGGPPLHFQAGCTGQAMPPCSAVLTAVLIDRKPTCARRVAAANRVRGRAAGGYCMAWISVDSAETIEAL
jgi:hypothetical protein